MDEKKVRQIVSDMLMSFDNMVVPQHTHNGVDCLQIQSSNLLPYNFVPSLPDKSGTAGQILYSPTLGEEYIFLNGKWNTLQLNASGLEAKLSVDTVIPDNVETTIVFDNVLYDPNSDYNDVTGFFVPNGFYIITATATFQSSGFSGGPIELTVYSVDNTTPLLTTFTTDSNDVITAQITFMAALSTTISIHIKQTSGHDKTLDKNNSGLFIKRFINP